MIELKNISKTYKAKKGNNTLALQDVSFKLPEKGLFCILGKSGSGKSTLLNIIGGLDKYDNGDIIVDNKSTKKFKNKDWDYYRNTYVGFIFQEFNLLDEYNVYDNIILSIKLQKEKVLLDRIDKLLTNVGIEGLGKRRINELSGGQKQRVAIARALVKNPDIILADEPTGSLDEETGKQIFELLKIISSEKLVIVVTHDREYANQYADGVIEIQDGKIVSNNIENNNVENRTFKTKKSRLPFKDSIKFAFSNLSSHKVKLFFTILLVFMSIVFFGTSKILSKFDIEKSHSETMVNSKNEYITLKKGTYNQYDKTWYDGTEYTSFNEEDINEISKQLESPYRLKYVLNEDNKPITLDIDYKNMMSTKDTKAYYLMIPSVLKFIETDDEFINQNIIGKYPENSDEIMIHSYLADFIMHYGIALYEENTSQFKKEYYKPTDYDDLLSGDKYYKLGSTKVKITGIIMDDTDQFQFLKEIPYQQIVGVNEETWLGVPKSNKMKGFNELIALPSLDVYVANGFIQNIGLKTNSIIDGSYYSIQMNNGEQTFYISGDYGYLNKKTTVFNGTKTITIDKLNEKEIIVPESYLDSLSKNEYTKLKEQYIKNYNNNIRQIEIDNKAIRDENEQLMAEYNKKLEIGEEAEIPLLKEEKEIVYMDDNELTQKFLQNYIKENNVMNQNISIIFRSTQDESKTKTISDLKIIGVEISGNNVYVPNTIGNEFMRNNYEINNVVIKESKQKNIEEIFHKFPSENSKYMSTTTYSNNINNISLALENVSFIAKYASYIFGFFAFVLLTNFIITSIYYNKKTIGILRGMGARKSDVFKIFLNEGLIIGIFSLVLAIITLYVVIYFTNSYISNHLFFDINFIMFLPRNLFIIIFSVLIIIIISTLFTVRRIAKMNPVDAILNK